MQIHQQNGLQFQIVAFVRPPFQEIGTTLKKLESIKAETVQRDQAPSRKVVDFCEKKTQIRELEVVAERYWLRLRDAKYILPFYELDFINYKLQKARCRSRKKCIKVIAYFKTYLLRMVSNCRRFFDGKSKIRNQ